MNESIVFRETKYCRKIREIMPKLGHATNFEVLIELRKTFPTLSATTVHRATARLAERCELGIAPPTHEGAMRYDANSLPHEHFSCRQCDRLIDIVLDDATFSNLQREIGDNIAERQITICGICANCNRKLDQYT